MNVFQLSKSNGIRFEMMLVAPFCVLYLQFLGCLCINFKTDDEPRSCEKATRAVLFQTVSNMQTKT